ncbi:MAG: hypothetical protein ACOZAG_01980 [Patescibacteria group bacterium]
MNSRLRRLERTIERCLKIEDVFTRRGVCGKEPIHYDDLIAGFEAPKRNGFDLSWSLVSSRPPKEDREEPPYIEVLLGSDETRCTDSRLIEVLYLPTRNVWVVEGSNFIGNDGNDALRTLASDCRLSAGETRQISEAEAMQIIAILVSFYKSQPAG